MYRLSPIIFLLGLTINLLAQNPHGSDFKMDCAACHTSEGWEISAEFWKNNAPAAPIISSTTGRALPNQSKGFNHNSTEFILEGQHTQTDCRACHQSLVFSEAQTTCVSCHTDMHNQTVGMDCARCHHSENWLVADITQLHFDNGFPLIGSHAIASCNECHVSDTDLRYDRIGNECINCHLDEYSATTNPNHASAGFSTNCIECHNINGFDWSTENINHDFFPLSKGHEIEDCARCHTTGNYNNTSTDCYSCHKEDYTAAINPNHTNQHFPMDCMECHTTDPGWTPAEYLLHDVTYFPIYNGEHSGEWDQCVECHTNPSNYAQFTCTTCHESGETGNEHRGVGGYSYNSIACLACHPTGNEDDNFDHNLTNFALTGEHMTAECAQCHTAGYTGTPTTCASCHTPEFNQTTSPNHNELGLSNDCAACHTTEPEWNPATFANHNEYHALNGAHAVIANDCAACHNGDYINTPNTCVNCHLDEYNASTDPNHAAQQFSTDCMICHTENAWDPATFDHNQTNFALLGAHTTTDCLSCHESGYEGTPTDCASCHMEDFNSTTDPNHVAQQFSTDCKICHTENAWDPATFDHNQTTFALIGAHTATDCISCHDAGYEGTPTDCASCHMEDFNSTTDPNHVAQQFSTDCKICHAENAWDPATLDHNMTNFPLTGEHINTECAQCHTAGYAGTPTTCASCHTDDFNQTTNPNHNTLGLSTDCSTCHTTEPEWNPATFANHNDYHVLNGAHITIANDCASCHNGDYINTPNTCVGCHLDEYNATTDPNHAAQQFSTDCMICHSENAWDPATFDHNQTNFALVGAHTTTDCISCHDAGYEGTPTDCASCHMEDFNSTTDPNHVAQQFSTDCMICHTENAWDPATFNHNQTTFALVGAHTTTDCISCHAAGYEGTPTDCASCHIEDFNSTTDPNHVAQQFSTDCKICHTENAWDPSTLDHNMTNFPLTGEHINTDCAQCHTAGYAGTPTTCASCHTDDFNQTTNPNHNTLGLSTDCASCHTTEPEWNPATFANHNDYHALNGAHAVIANDCATCHNGDYINTPNTCVGCHLSDYNTTTNPDHSSAQFPTDCESCHTENAWEPSTFDHDGQYFPINSGKHMEAWNQCLDCHSVPANFSVFACIECHEHSNLDDLNDKHSEEQDYTYTSIGCFTCHPNGNKD